MFNHVGRHAAPIDNSTGVGTARSFAARGVIQEHVLSPRPRDGLRRVDTKLPRNLVDDDSKPLAVFVDETQDLVRLANLGPRQEQPRRESGPAQPTHRVNITSFG